MPCCGCVWVAVDGESLRKKNMMWGDKELARQPGCGGDDEHVLSEHEFCESEKKNKEK